MCSLIISAIGADRPGIVSELTGIITNHGGNIEESRMTRLGSDFVIIMLISADSEWKESLVLALHTIKELSITVKTTKSKVVITGDHCKITLNGADNEGIVNILSKYLTEKSMNILDMETRLTNAPVTGTPLFNLIAITTIPENADVADIQSDLTLIARKLGIEIIVNKSEINAETEIII